MLAGPEGRSALRVTGLYLLAGALWLVVFDELLGAAAPDLARWEHLHLLHGWALVLLSGVLLLVLVARDRRSTAISRRGLRAREELLVQVGEQTRAAIWSYAPNDGRVLFTSPVAERIWGVPVSEIYRDTRAVLDRVVPEDRERVERALEKGDDAAVEFRITRPDGSTAWLRSLARPVRDEAGRVVSVVGFTEDVTEEREAEEALKESEKRFQQLADNIPQVYWMTSLDKGQVIFVSRAYETIWGRPCGALLANPREWMEAIHPEDRPRIAEAFPGQPEGRYDQEYRVIRPDGQVRWIRDRAFPVRDSRGRVHRVAGIAEDVTDRHERERELTLLASAITQAGEAVLITDASGAIEYVNPAFERITGYAREEVLGRNPRVLKSGEQGPEFYDGMWATLRAGDPWHGRFVNERRDGTRYTQDAVITPIRSGSGEISHFVAVLRDVSRELELEEQVRHAQKMEALGRLAGGIAHDFNNVLMAIQGHARFVREALEPSHPAGPDVDHVLSAAAFAHDLTRQLLAFSRQQPARPRVVEMGEVVRGTEAMLRRLIGEDVEMVVAVAPDAGRVEIDPSHVEQVLVNLAVNARDAMPRGGRLTVEVGAVEVDEVPAGAAGSCEPGSWVRLRVADTGVGMDPETRERIFEPFFTTKPPGKGTGLGLSTVFGIVQQAGGCLAVASAPGEGTRFDIHLPRTGKPVESRAPRAESKRGMGSGTVLLVEDQPAVRSVVRRILDRAGYRVLEASDGEEGLRTWEAHAHEVDLLVTDVVMPRMGGRALVRRVRERRADLPVLLMSGYAPGDAESEGKKDPETHVLQKPFEAGVLREAVGRILGEGPGEEPDRRPPRD